MDNSKEFSLMLNKAIECQPKDFKNFDKTKNVQDQLQEMVSFAEFNPTSETHYKVAQFAYYIKTIHLLSMEQLWLAFVMSEKFKKKWNGEKWQLSS